MRVRLHRARLLLRECLEKHWFAETPDGSKEDPVSRLNGLLQILTLRCEAASELSSRELDESLPRLDRAALWCHLLACRSCRRFRKQIRVIREAVRRRERLLAETDATRDSFPRRRDRIARAIREAGRDGAGSDAEVD